MNVYKQEWRQGLKRFIFWMVGLFVLVFAGMTKYTGIETGGVDVMKIFDSFPKILLAVLGIVEVDISTLEGYYALLIFYVMIYVALYGISLGIHVINGETVNKTYEFVFTRPRKRRHILTAKLSVAMTKLTIFAFMNGVISVLAVLSLNTETSMNKVIVLYSVSIFLIGMLFVAIGMVVASYMRQAEKGFFVGNMIFLAAFLIGIIYDSLEKASFLRPLTPFRYFLPTEVLSGELNAVAVLGCLIVSVVLSGIAIWHFESKDLTAL